MNFYSEPEQYGLETIGEIDWSDGNYQFNLTVVWKRTSDGKFVYGNDLGCSCPSPFEDTRVDSLTVLRKRGGLTDFKKHLEERQAEDLDWHGAGYREREIAELLERMHKAGAR